MRGASRRKWVTTPARGRNARPALTWFNRNCAARGTNRFWL